MSMGPLGGIVGSSAGAPLSQTKGAESERSQRESATQQRLTDAARQADQASGIGQTEEDQQSSERDADGRRLWEAPTNASEANEESSGEDLRQSKDATGVSGNQLDITG